MAPNVISAPLPQVLGYSGHVVHPSSTHTQLSPAYSFLRHLQCSTLACTLSAIAIVSVSPIPPAFASIPLTAAAPQEQQLRALGQMGVTTRRINNNKTMIEETDGQKIERIMALMTEATEASRSGDWTRALEKQTAIISRYPDLALAERARVARGLLLYQVGRTSDALLQLEDEEVALRGNAEVHAALATIFYDLGKPVQSEQQWAIATEFDKRYSDISWVEKERHWPPRLLAALDRFLHLT